MPMTLCCSAILPALCEQCDNCADDLQIVFNAKKSKCIRIGSRLKQPYCLPEFYIRNVAIEFVDEWPYLINFISFPLRDKLDIMNKRNTLYQQINNVLCVLSVVIRLLN